MYDPALKGRMAELQARKAQIDAASAMVHVPEIVVPPDLPNRNRDNVGALAASLNDEAARPEAIRILRTLIEGVVLTPDKTAPNGLRAELHGLLAGILDVGHGTSETAKSKHPGVGSPGCQLSVVAGTGFEPVTFRL